MQSISPNAADSALPHIIVVDDDPHIRTLLGQLLERYGFRVSAVHSGSELWPTLERDKPQLVVLDLMLPGEDGLTLCRALRTRSQVPVIMLTARDDAVDRVVGLELGADDYVGKPFDPRELIARIRSVLRRYSAKSGEPIRRKGYKFDGWVLDLSRRELRSPTAAVVSLSTLEFRLLELLLDSAGSVLSRDQIMEAVAGRSADPFDRRVDIAISRLRTRLNDCGRESRLIKTIRSRGYLFTAEVIAC